MPHWHGYWHDQQVGVQVYQANADTDSLIVSKVLSSVLSGKPVVVVRTDTDLLVVMVSLYLQGKRKAFNLFNKN